MNRQLANRVLDWNADNAETFAPAFGSEMFWLWTKEDKERFPCCAIKGNMRVVLVTWNDSCDEDEYVITFRSGATRVVTQELLQAATLQHNTLVKATAKGIKTQRSEALAEMTTPAYSISHGFREIPTKPNEAQQSTAT